MEQRLSLVTLGVADLARARKFYEEVIGWKAAESPPGVVFFDLGGLVFSLFPHGELAKDAELGQERSIRPLTIGAPHPPAAARSVEY
ncbi:MAG: hypothetical protein EXR28_06500 [Betaproteobacteria bacterium]|nr:hypothetical protein [Betaproteobacteria bacterium]